MITLNKTQQFIVFCIEQYKKSTGITGMQAYIDFKKYGVFSFLESGYEVLHTQGHRYIIQEITVYIQHQK